MFVTSDGGEVPTTSGRRVGGVLPMASITFNLPNVGPFGGGRLPFASLSHLPTVEGSTSVAFPAEFCTLSAKACPQLTGVGCVALALASWQGANNHRPPQWLTPADSLAGCGPSACWE